MQLDLKLKLGDTVKATIDGQEVTIKLVDATFLFGALPGVNFNIVHTVNGDQQAATVTDYDLKSWFRREYWYKVE